MPLFKGFEGQAARIYLEISIILKTALNKPDDAIRFGAGRRHNRLISIIKNEKLWVPDLFQLSTGEVLLINLFLSIIRDFDLSKNEINQLSDVKGIVVIDEIDAHLHTIHQREIPPKLLKLFPKVQFIITSHSPLFLLGMDECYGADGFQIINMPDGKSISSGDFSEFQVAFDAFRETKQHRDAIDKILAQRSAPIVYVEGDYDIRYLNKAANLFKKEELLSKIHLKDGGGFGNLDKIWRSYDNALAHLPECKIVLLYDCDQERKSENKGKIYRSAMKIVEENPIQKGIENLFPEEAISKAENFKPEFIDVFEASRKRERGIITDAPLVKKVNKDEKGNLCDWLCSNGTEEDFKYFLTVLEQVESILNSQN
ncbi:AAA family ATPase [Comamonas thiooxydans]|uniref:AAA family ATPase n=1 Tax=Comamonas thiooxydans TaxID=363952 RepID=UPI000A67939C|nr:AAA family ATPase [Comamonas thiooxydans]